MAKILNFKIDQYATGQRVDRYLMQKLRGTGFGYVAIQRLCRNGQVRIDGKRVPAGFKLERGMEIKLPAPDDRTQDPRQGKPKTSAKTKANAAAVSDSTKKQWRNSIIYDDDRMIVINKWSGLAVQGGTGTSLHVDAITRAVYGEQAPKLVHRLDKDTSGVLVLAKTREDAALLTKAFAEQEVHKTYVALVQGRPKRAEARIDYPLLKKMRFDSEKVEIDLDEGADATTDYATLAGGNGFTLLSLHPRTGRTHQLRVHCAAIGCPIVGDGKYNDHPQPIGDLPKNLRLHLHAERLALRHPLLGELAFKAPLPEHMQRSLDALQIKY
jgi:23S rRNA pseudouridine955/2504/2580 synthase